MEQRLVNPRLELVFRLAVYASSVWISVKYAAGYWVVGPVFGLAVVSYDSNTLRNLAARRHGLFIIASTLIYALVYRLSIAKWSWPGDAPNYFAGPFPLAIVTGSVLLPLAQRLIFKAPADRTLRAVLALIATFYVVTLFSYLNDRLGWQSGFNFLTTAVAVWQGVYLWKFFGKK